jgi:flagellar basal body-associated protein FliL
MADHKDSDADLDDVAEAAGRPWWKSSSILCWFGAIVVASIVFQVVLFVVLRKAATAKPTAIAEYTVGTFTFASAGADEKPISGQLDLHLRFVEDLDAAARQRLAAHKFRVRESIESVLRKSHELDLGESALARLKHEVQEKVDAAIDLRAVAEVIFTDINVEPRVIDASLAKGSARSSAENKSVAKTTEPAEATAMSFEQSPQTAAANGGY